MAIDSNGRTHLVYSVHVTDTFNVTLLHAIVDGGNVSRRVIAEARLSEYDFLEYDYVDILNRYRCFVTMDSTGEPVAIVYDGTEGQIWCYTNLTGDVTSELIVSESSDYGYGLSLLAEEVDLLHVFWLSAETDANHMSLRHVFREEGTWTHTSQMTDLPAQGGVALEVAGRDTNGALRAFARTYDNDTLLCLKESGNVWVSEVVRTEPRFTGSTPVHDYELQRWIGAGGVSAVRDAQGNFIISKPYGYAGILTDNVTMIDRLREASSTMFLFILIAVPIALLCIPMWKAAERECLWARIIRGRR